MRSFFITRRGRAGLRMLLVTVATLGALAAFSKRVLTAFRQANRVLATRMFAGTKQGKLRSRAAGGPHIHSKSPEASASPR
jgi:hypothetical protein